MKCFGTITLHEDVDKVFGSKFWEISAEPHVMIKLKQVFGKVNKVEFGRIKIKDSLETCRDIEWFTLRYPMVFSNLSHRKHLAKSSTAYQDKLEALEKIILPDHVPNITGLAKPLRDYQQRLVEIFSMQRAILNADDLGLGKSVEAIGGMLIPGTMPALVVCHAHLPGQWKDYFAEYLPAARVHIIAKSKVYDLPDADVYICTYHKLTAWANVMGTMIKMVVFDECQELRHPESGKYAAARQIRQGADWCMGLSATPIHNYGGEFFNIMEIIAPGSLSTRGEFEREWCQHSGKNALLKDPHAFGTYLRENFLMVRRSRKDVGRELPPVQTFIQEVEFRQEVLDENEDVAMALALKVLSGSFHESGEAAREFDMRLRMATGIAKAPFVIAFVKILVEAGHKVILAGWHRDVYDIWKTYLENEQIKYAFYTGSETPTVKTQNARRFMNGEIDVFIMSLHSGVGLDGLQAVCYTVVHGELDWSPAWHKQVRGRVGRDGQLESVQEYYLVANGGSDPIVADVLGLKNEQHGGLMGTTPETGLELKQTEDLNRVKTMAQKYVASRKTV